jgi:hypothetical protein
MKAPLRRTLLGAVTLAGLATAMLAATTPARAAEEWTLDPRQNAAMPRTTRAELYRVLDTYLAALKVRDPQRVQWAPRVRNTENNVPLMAGDGLWGTITALGSYDLRFADPLTGQVAYFGTVTETTEESAYTLRLKVVAIGARSPTCRFSTSTSAFTRGSRKRSPAAWPCSSRVPAASTRWRAASSRP